MSRVRDVSEDGLAVDPVVEPEDSSRVPVGV
jgi:hypothetical protein